jgi:hypothetical protein
MKTYLLILLTLAGFVSAQTLIPETPAPPVPQGQRIADAMVTDCNRLFAERITRFKDLWLQLWENPTATPTEILEGYSTRGKIMFQAAAAERQWMTTIATALGTTPEALLGDTKYLTPAAPVTFHQDGTVTLAP